MCLIEYVSKLVIGDHGCELMSSLLGVELRIILVDLYCLNYHNANYSTIFTIQPHSLQQHRTSSPFYILMPTSPKP